jgi:hypothetical protein
MSAMWERTLVAGHYRPAINRIINDVAHPSRLILPKHPTVNTSS